jgi:hypothetical protein
MNAYHATNKGLVLLVVHDEVSNYPLRFKRQKHLFEDFILKALSEHSPPLHIITAQQLVHRLQTNKENLVTPYDHSPLNLQEKMILRSIL